MYHLETVMVTKHLTVFVDLVMSSYFMRQLRDMIVQFKKKKKKAADERKRKEKGNMKQRAKESETIVGLIIS